LPNGQIRATCILRGQDQTVAAIRLPKRPDKGRSLQREPATVKKILILLIPILVGTPQNKKKNYIMTDVLKYGKKAFTWSVVVLTILWSVGVSTLVPLVANATSPTLVAGDLFKVVGVTSVYLVTSDLKAVYFPLIVFFDKGNGHRDNSTRLHG